MPIKSKLVSEIGSISNYGISRIDEEPLQMEDDTAGIQKLEYPLKEKVLNDKG